MTTLQALISKVIMLLINVGRRNLLIKLRKDGTTVQRSMITKYEREILKWQLPFLRTKQFQLQYL